MHKKIGFAIIGMALVASPLFASASTLSDLQAQLQSLLLQIAAIQRQMAGLPASSSAPVMCTMEVKQCPDGSYVGRSGPNCEFASCGQAAMPSRVCPQILRSLSQGSTGNDVMNLQSYLGVSPTGYFGPLTASAVARFQASEGLSQVGIVGPLTRAAFARRCGYTQSDSFSASPMRGAAPLSVNFTYAPRTEDVGQYYIEFGDGEGQLMDTQQIYCIRAPCVSPSVASHTYPIAGTYIATVSPYTACLYSEPRCEMAQPPPLAILTITVTDGSTNSATFSATPTSGSAPLSVQFHYLAYGGQYQIDFGDGASSSTHQCLRSYPGQCNTTHTYTTPGTYTAKLLQSDPIPACYYATPPCLMPVRAPQVIGTATITVR